MLKSGCLQMFVRMWRYFPGAAERIVVSGSRQGRPTWFLQIEERLVICGPVPAATHDEQQRPALCSPSYGLCTRANPWLGLTAWYAKCNSHMSEPINRIS